MSKPVGPSESTEKWIEFEHYQYILRGGGEDSDPDVAEVCHRYRAKVANPEAGKVIQGKVHSWQYEDDGAQYAIVDCAKGYLAIRSDLYIPKTRFHDYQIRSVVLDEPGRPLAWEICHRNDLGSWAPVEGQHLRSRTAEGTQWLQEIGRVSNRLKEREGELSEARRMLVGPERDPTVKGGLVPGKHSGDGGLNRESTEKLDAINRELASVRKEIARADGLVHHLGQRRGTSVTLLESAIEGRTLEVLPDLPPNQAQALTVSASQKIRM